MPTITELMQSIQVRVNRRDDWHALCTCAISGAPLHGKRLDLSWKIVKYVTDFDYFCQGIAKSEDLVAVYMHHGGTSLASKVLQKFYLALSLCPNLHTLDLGKNDYWDIRFCTFDTNPEEARALPDNIFFENLQIFNLRTVYFQGKGTDYFQSLGTFLSKFPNLHTVMLDNIGYGYRLRPDWWMSPNLKLLAEALSQAPNLHTLSLQGNQFSCLSTERFIIFYKSLLKCRALTHLIGIESFKKQDQDMLNKLLSDNKKQIPLVKEFTSFDRLPDFLKQIVLEYVVPKEALPIIFSKRTERNPLDRYEKLYCNSLKYELSRIWNTNPLSM